MSRKWLVISISIALLVLGTSVFTAQASPADSDLWRLVKAAYHHLQDQIDDLQDQIENMAMKATYEVMSESQISPVSPHTIFLHCDDGDKVTGGGFEHNGGLEILASRPDYFPESQSEAWRVEAVTKGATNEILRSYGVCLDLPPLRP